jgi:two-component system response regulator AtoC
MSLKNFLIVDHDEMVRQFLAETLQKNGGEVTFANSGRHALKLLKEFSYDMVFTEMKTADLSGLDFLRQIKELPTAPLVVIVTAYGSIENSVEAMRLGAFNYILKPFSSDTIETVVEKASDIHSHSDEPQNSRPQIISSNRTLPKIIAESPMMKQILVEVEQIAQSNASVFISGETGTGKEVIANAIHFNSPRVLHPFIKVNCASVPEALIESEFFGHEKGAFTGASAKRLGRFELAHGGSLLLDEVTEIPSTLQAKLLRAVQERAFERLGGNKAIKVDVRFISTSNRNIQEAVANKILRADLYYRLNVIPIHLPPLRERPEDIIALAEYFLEKMCLENHKEMKKLSPGAKKKLSDYWWPGNIRELANIIERVVVLNPAVTLKGEHLYLTEK